MLDSALSRRRLLMSLPSAACAASMARNSLVAHAAQQVGSASQPVAGCTLGFSTYGMQSLTTEKAIKAIGDIGFDALEITVRPGWDAAPDNLPAQRRWALREMIRDEGLRLSSLMEHAPPARDPVKHTQQLQQLNRVFQLANDLAGETKPIVQTVLGGKDWMKEREFLRDRLATWLELAKQQDVVLAIKPHRGGAMDEPSKAAWLLKQLNSPQHLRIVYDYSHYAFRDLSLAETIATALPLTAHVAVKDAVQKGGRIVFDLPGQSDTIDFASLIRQFHAGGYRGDINCEVSSQVFRQPHYDPIAAAKKCYQAMSKAFADSGVPRIG